MAFGKRTGRGMSRVAAVVAAYALVLQAFFAGAAMARMEAAGHGEVAYAICLGEGGSETPAEPHNGKIQCALCAASTHVRAIDTTSAILPVVYGETRVVVWPLDFDGRPAVAEFFQHRTRGPPTA